MGPPRRIDPTTMSEHLWSYIFASVLKSDALFCINSNRKEGNVLFNDALNTFYIRLYGVRHMVKDHSDSEKRNPLLPHRLLSD